MDGNELTAEELEIMRSFDDAPSTVPVKGTLFRDKYQALYIADGHGNFQMYGKKYSTNDGTGFYEVPDIQTMAEQYPPSPGEYLSIIARAGKHRRNGPSWCHNLLISWGVVIDDPGVGLPKVSGMTWAMLKQIRNLLADDTIRKIENGENIHKVLPDDERAADISAARGGSGDESPNLATCADGSGGSDLAPVERID